MPRIPTLLPAELDGEQRALYDAIVDGPRGGQPSVPVGADGGLRGPFNALLLSPPVGDAVQQLGAALRYRSTLPARIRELATLAVAAHWDSGYEWRSHERLGRAAGVTPAELDAVRAGVLPPLPDATENAALRMVRHLLDGEVADDAYAELVGVLGEAAVFELSTLVGYYGLLALQLRLFRVH